MATEKPRFSVSFKEETFEKIQEYKEEHNISTRSKTVAQLVELVLDRGEGSRETEKSPSLSSEAMRIARDYQSLDKWGRQAVRELVETETARCRDEARFMADAVLEEEPKVINLFVEPSAAGIAVPAMGRDYEPYELKPEDPQGAAYAVRIQGDSMEPDFPDGSVAFVNHDALRDGDVGIFSVDGGTVCKQYHQVVGSV